MSTTEKKLDPKELKKKQVLFCKELEDQVAELAQHFGIRVNIDYDERGSVPRFSVSLLNNFTDPGVGNVRSYT